MGVSRTDVATARGRIEPLVRSTPVLSLDGDSLGVAHRLHLKLEHLQQAGSFKARGALNNLLSREVPDSGVVAASGGNHGVAVAWAAATLGHRAHLFVPETASPTKIAAVEAHGAEVHLVGRTYDQAREAADQHQDRTGALGIEAYDHPATIAGAATMAAELDQQVDDLDTIVVAVGGGGLSAGVVAWFGTGVRIVAVEGEGTNCLAAALAAGRPVDTEVHGITADALGAGRIGRHTFELLRGADLVAVTVPDADIMSARQALWASTRLAVEPAGAAPLAALRSGAYRPEPDESVAVIVCGANTDPATLSEG